MTANQIIANLAATAERMYAGEPAVDRLAFHNGMLESKLREYIYLLESIKQEINDLEQLLEAK
jgi:hypothetical protein